MNKKLDQYKKTAMNRPGYYDYKNMHHEFRPYIMFANAENYNTRFVSTDKFGFRKTVNKDNKKIELSELKDNHNDCNVILGGSTAFGMGCSSDRNTIASELSAQGIFCQNFGIRAATSQQELIVFLQFKRYLSRIRNILILSGGNDISVAAHNSSFFYPDFGFMFAEDIRFNHFWHQEDDFTLTSRGVIWTYPNKELTPKSICVLPERNNDNSLTMLPKELLGICSDYIVNYKHKR